MKGKMLALVLVVAVLPSACAVAETGYTYYGTMMVENCESWVSLRDGPGTGCGRLAKVPLYAIVTDAEWEPICGDFIYCSYDGQYGYILSQYLVPWADPEPDPDERFDSEQGFSFWYDSSVLTVDADMSEDGRELMLCPVDSELPVYLEIMTAESVGMLSWKFLEVNAPVNTEYVEDETWDESEMHWFQKRADHSDDILQTYYAIDGAENSVVAVGTCPADEAVKWGAQFSAVMHSITFKRAFAEAVPVWAAYAEPTGDLLVVDQDGEYVALEADEAVTDVKLLALELTDFDEDGNVAYDTDVLYEQDALTPGMPLTVKIAFPGDIPGYGLQFVDAAGETRRFAIQMSGRDGSLIMDEF